MMSARNLSGVISNVGVSESLGTDEILIETVPNVGSVDGTNGKSEARRIVPELHLNAKTRWTENGVTVAGNNISCQDSLELKAPSHLHVDNDQTIYIADSENHRIIKYTRGDRCGRVVAGGNGPGNELHQLNIPLSVFVDKEKDCIYICDHGNERVMCWPLQGGTSGTIIIDKIKCAGLTMDNQGFLYISNVANNSVEKWQIGATQGKVVAGGNGEGSNCNQLNYPTHLFVTRDQTVYVSDLLNRRVMKWAENATEGISVADDKSLGNDSTQLSVPGGILVDQLNTVYVVDHWQDQIMRWPEQATQGTVIAGGRGRGSHPNQLDRPDGLSFDLEGNLYVADCGNNRVQKFDVDFNPSVSSSSVCSIS